MQNDNLTCAEKCEKIGQDPTLSTLCTSRPCLVGMGVTQSPTVHRIIETLTPID